MRLAPRATQVAPVQAGRPPRWLARAEELLRAHAFTQRRLGEVAAQVGVHPVHLQRVFRAHHGMSMGAYQRRLRLDWAARMLVSSEQPIVDIALEAGFADHSHFTRSFQLA
jgi:AraC family transcriptional regulator